VEFLKKFLNALSNAAAMQSKAMNVVHTQTHTTTIVILHKNKTRARLTQKEREREREDKAN
jgi:hypothetical protein